MLVAVALAAALCMLYIGVHSCYLACLIRAEEVQIRALRLREFEVVEHLLHHRPRVGSCGLCNPSVVTFPAREDLPDFYRAHIRNHEARAERLRARRYELW